MKIKLKTYDEAHFVCAENGGGQELIANRTSPREWETFDVIGQFMIGGNISLRTYNGTNFVCAEDGGGKGLIANRTSAGIWETFKIIDPNGKTDCSPIRNGDKISLQTYDGKHYVCAEDGGSRELVANRTEAHEWETFTVQFASIALKTYDGAHFVCAENGGGRELVANRTEAHEWETFDVLGEFVFGGSISLRTYNGTNFVCAEDGGGKGLIANRTSAGIWETFKIIGPNGKTDGLLVQNGDKISFHTYDNKHFICAEGGGDRELVANRIEAHEWETFTAQFASTSAAPTPTVRIIHISDPHFTDSPITFDAPIDFQNGPKRSENLALYLHNHKSQLGTNIVVITGDLTDSGDPGDYQIARDFIQRLKNSGFVVYAIPGNHDYCKEGTLGNQLKPIGIGGKDNTRRQWFIDYIDSITHQSSQYPQVINFGSCKLILLDSMQAEMDEDTGDLWAQGKLGENQLSTLKQLLAGYEQQRKNGTKIIVALHHHPFKPAAADTAGVGGGLDDAQQFMEIIANKIDCLLFGHSTPDPGICQQFFSDEATMYGIPIINVENMEHMNYSNGKITVVDLASNIIEVYSTDESQPPKPTPGKTPSWIDRPMYYITPVVTRSVAVYNYLDAAPSIKFQSGDTVTMFIGGGVQTGGRGKTWKRYVNPSGSNSDRLYFGQIYIPGITDRLTPISNLVAAYGNYISGHPDTCYLKFTIPNIDAMPESSRYLSLGYVDDNYDGNGFWNHDDGTEDQCKNIKSAYLEITLYRKGEDDLWN